MKELVVISGKGGTGKTSVTGSFASLAENTVFADCDVDAADLHLILQPQVLEEQEFISGKEAYIRKSDCTACGKCLSNCRFDAVFQDDDGKYQVYPYSCEGCGVCVRFCPADAIDFEEQVCGKYYKSETRFGYMMHAKLGIGAENSGKLITLIRENARSIAQQEDSGMILIDGPPGTGCPVISSLTGADYVLIVSEPSLSGRHDLKRVASVAAHFGIPVFLCVNKSDINSEMTELIENEAVKNGIKVIGRIPYDPAITDAQIQGKSVVEYGDSPASAAIKKIWTKLQEEVN